LGYPSNSDKEDSTWLEEEKQATPDQDLHVMDVCMKLESISKFSFNSK